MGEGGAVTRLCEQNCVRDLKKQKQKQIAFYTRHVHQEDCNYPDLSENARVLTILLNKILYGACTISIFVFI